MNKHSTCIDTVFSDRVWGCVFWSSSIPTPNLLHMKHSGMTWNILFCFVNVGRTLTCKQRRWRAHDSVLTEMKCSYMRRVLTWLCVHTSRFLVLMFTDHTHSISVLLCLRYTTIRWNWTMNSFWGSVWPQAATFPEKLISHEMPESAESFQSSRVMRF